MCFSGCPSRFSHPGTVLRRCTPAIQAGTVRWRCTGTISRRCTSSTAPAPRHCTPALYPGTVPRHGTAARTVSVPRYSAAVQRRGGRAEVQFCGAVPYRRRVPVLRYRAAVQCHGTVPHYSVRVAVQCHGTVSVPRYSAVALCLGTLGP